jgi:Tol biopolymer transport system component
MELRRGRINRGSIVAVAMMSAALGLAGCSDPAPEQTPAEEASATNSDPGGRIAFTRLDPALDEEESEESKMTYTVNPDGSDVQQLFSSGHSESPHWSPAGSEIAIFCCDNGMAGHLLDPDTGDLREFPPPDPSLETHCGGAWSPDGERLACEVFGVDDPSLNGIYSIRSSDGGGLTRITSNPGGDDIPGDYSPDGKRLVFIRFEEQRPVGFFVTNVDGSGLRQISPPDMIVDDSGFGGSWSPDGNQILFVALASEDAHKAIWVVNADGSSLHQLPITPECGGLFSDPTSAGCYSPSWSPDGSKIVFTRSSPDGERENIYTVNAGSDLFQVTDGGGDDNPDWGTQPPST